MQSVADTLCMRLPPGHTASAMEQMPAGEREDAAAGERALLRRARAGDKAAFEQLISGHERKALTIAWRMLGNRDDALDATQDALIRLFRYLHRVDDSRDFGAWVYRVVVNSCLDLHKKRRRAEATPVEATWTGAGDGSHFQGGAGAGAGAEERLDRKRESNAILAAIAHLPVKERAAIVLRDLEGLPTPEVARILQSSEATIRSQISSARNKLRVLREQLLSGHGPHGRNA